MQARIVSGIALVMLVTSSPTWSQCSLSTTAKFGYAPPDVAEAHPAHELTLFLPAVPPPADTGLYPTLLYCPASIFSEATAPSLDDGFVEFEPLLVLEPDPGGGGGPGSGQKNVRGSEIPWSPLPPPESAAESVACGFLATALARGWAVITVGTTGWNSWPTCSQLEDCTECHNDPAKDPDCGFTPSCWDTNLWYAPGTPEWDDFNMFYGEKDLTWARQWIGLNAAGLGLDNDKIVACGTSTGAIYSAFLAYGENRAWDGTHSAQAQVDTRVAGIVSFESNTWLKALNNTWGGVHWPSSLDSGDLGDKVGCTLGPGAWYNRRATVLRGDSGEVAEGLLEESSVSRWVREVTAASERPAPTFVATGDGFLTTGFARNANLPAFAADYDRHEESLLCGTSTGENALIDGDPVLQFTSPPTEVRLHDSWYAVNYKIDLLMLDDAYGAPFHDRRSRLFLQDGHVWSFLPPCLSTTPFAPITAAEVSVLDGTYALEPVQSIDNTDLAPKVVDWMEAELCVERTLGVVCRNPVIAGPAGVPNPDYSNYEASTAIVGVPIPVEVDLKESPDYELMSVMVCTAAYPPGGELVLSPTQVLLCDIGTMLFTTPFVGADPDGVARTTLGAATPAGLTFYTQAILIDAGGGLEFALTNAQDITIQPTP